ncbi:hypothetical protein [Duganella sp. LjRoot269]|jgi:hypothetical protein|uniref:hypothetical protein n=1 Tax=Duganella sp. LjRoot269 TaxID=3342305 RepID=UPI003ECE6F61
MKLRNLYAVFALLFAVLCWSPAVQALPFTFTFAAQPAGGSISGLPGETVGWGYELVNTDTLNWFVPTQLSASSFSIGSPDASYFDFPILVPGAAATVAFDAALHTGLYGVQIFPFALPGQIDSGSFSLSGEWWSGDPLSGGTFLQAADVVVSPFSLEVAGITAVPLPGSLPLLALGLVLLWVCQRRRKEGAQFGLGLR